MDDTQWAQGRVAFITGASSGFGAAFARRMLAAGAHVVATARRLERLAELDAEQTGRLHAAAMDVTSPTDLAQVLATLPQAFQPIDILLNNAGLAAGLAKASEADFADWQRMIDTNVTGLARVSHTLLPGMVARGRGHILNLSSVAASYPYPGGNVYGATKAFVRQFSLNLRADLLRTPIKVTSIEPGMAETEFSVVRFKGDQSAADNVYAGMTPLSADDVVDALIAVLRLPEHVNVNTLELMPVQQAFGPFAVSRALKP